MLVAPFGEISGGVTTRVGVIIPYWRVLVKMLDAEIERNSTNYIVLF
jgi:hypothetical protein